MNSCAASPVVISGNLATARGTGAVTLLTIHRQSEIAPANVRQTAPHNFKGRSSDQTVGNPHRGDRRSRGGWAGSRARAHVQFPRHRHQPHPCGAHHHHHHATAADDHADCSASAGDIDSTRDKSADHEATPAANNDPAADHSTDCRDADYQPTAAADNGPAAHYSADDPATPASDNGPSGGDTAGRRQRYCPGQRRRP
jgi:hypothetical protein